MSTFITWVDSGSRPALSTNKRSNNQLCLAVEARENDDEVNIEEIQKMARKASMRIIGIKARQDVIHKTLSSLRLKHAT